MKKKSQWNSCTHQIIFWGIVAISMGLFAILLGEDGWGPTIGFIIGLIVGWQVLSEWDKHEKRKQENQIVSLNQGWITSGFGNENVGYTIVYDRGHRGTDHYLRMYARRAELPGTLVLSEIGIRFVSKVTKTEQKFTLNWNEVRGAEIQTPGNSRFYIDSIEHGLIFFNSSTAEKVTADIRQRLSSYEEQVARQEELIEKQIQSRNLNSIPPSKFEKLIGKMFESMGYHVSQIGGTGDEGGIWFVKMPITMRSLFNVNDTLVRLVPQQFVTFTEHSCTAEH
jgi:hypothetical protein